LFVEIITVGQSFNLTMLDS